MWYDKTDKPELFQHSIDETYFKSRPIIIQSIGLNYIFAYYEKKLDNLYHREVFRDFDSNRKIPPNIIKRWSDDLKDLDPFN